MNCEKLFKGRITYYWETKIPQLIGKARCLAKIGVAGELLQHEVRSIRTRDFRQEKPVADAGADAIDAFSRTICQRRGADDDPIERALQDDGLLHGLIREQIPT